MIRKLTKEKRFVTSMFALDTTKTAILRIFQSQLINRMLF